MVMVYPTLKFCSAVCVTVVGVNNWSGDHSSAKLQEKFFASDIWESDGCDGFVRNRNCGNGVV